MAFHICFLSAGGLERYLVFTGKDWCEEESSGGFGFRRACLYSSIIVTQ
jgi:hypothetical protein